jgi:SAM-dependent methyltransferase
MAKAVFDDYLKEVLFQRGVWERKAVLRKLYCHWYQRVVRSLSPLRPVVEIGSGSGNFKEFFPEAVSTDVFQSGPWIDRVMDAHDLQLAEGEAGNIVACDVIHHLQRPLHFLRQAQRAVKTGGRLVLCEPAMSPWSRFVYQRFHHEPFDTGWDLFGLDSTPPDPDPGHTFANMGISEILFWKERARTMSLLPSFRLVESRKFAFVLYPLTGGFGYRSYVPSTGFSTLLKLEDAITGPFADWLTGMRMLVVLEKV